MNDIPKSLADLSDDQLKEYSRTMFEGFAESVGDVAERGSALIRLAGEMIVRRSDDLDLRPASETVVENASEFYRRLKDGVPVIMFRGEGSGVVLAQTVDELVTQLWGSRAVHSRVYVQIPITEDDADLARFREKIERVRKVIEEG